MIKAGDFVMVVRGTTCCGVLTGSEGYVFRVTSLTDKFSTCLFCRRLLVGLSGLAAYGLPNKKAIRVDRLKKIDPLQDPGHIVTDEEIPA